MPAPLPEEKRREELLDKLRFRGGDGHVIDRAKARRLLSSYASAIWEEAAREVPTNWLDPLLSGPAGIGLPAMCPGIEVLLNGVAKVLAARSHGRASAAAAAEPPSEQEPGSGTGAGG